MTENFGKFLSEQTSLSDNDKESIQEAWNAQLSEAKEEIAANLRQEFAEKFSHDKDSIIEGMQAFLETQIKSEIQELAEDKKQLSTATVEYKKRLGEHVEKLNSFIAESLANEIKEFRNDKKLQQKGLKNLQGFIVEELSKEIREFHQDKVELQEQRVKLIRGANKALAEAKRNFIDKATSVVSEGIEKRMAKEIRQFRGDILEAKNNMFGRKIFESFAAEYMNSHMNESSATKELQAQMDTLASKLEEAQQEINKSRELYESAERKAAVAQDRLARERTLAKLLGPLSRDKKKIMGELLESVKTPELEKTYNKYLPAVLNESPITQAHKSNGTLTESVRDAKTTEKTGDRAPSASDDSGLIELSKLQRLAGIVKQ